MNWQIIYKKYAGFWISMSDDEKTVISKGKTAKEALIKAQKKGFKKPILNYIPKKLITFVGFRHCF
ncbi:MAG: DUF5678 domain-containing protein [bacterium]